MTVTRKEYVFLKRNTAFTLLEDIIGWGVLMGCVWFNQTYCGGLWLVNLFIIAMFLAGIANYCKTWEQRFNTKQELIKYVESLPE